MFSYHDGLSLLGVQLRHRPAEAFGCRGGDVRGWHLCSSTRLCSLPSSSLPAFYRAGLTSKTLSNLLSPHHLSITTSLLSPPQAERRRGREGEKRFCPIKSNRHKDCRHPAFPDQTLPPPGCLHLKDFCSGVFCFVLFCFLLLLLLVGSLFSCPVSVRHICFPSLGVAWKGFQSVNR